MTRSDIPTPPTDDETHHDVQATTTIGDMSPRDFAQLGLNHIAYIRAVHGDDEDDTGWAIHAANGQRIGLAPSHDLALAATRQHDMEPLSVH